MAYQSQYYYNSIGMAREKIITSWKEFPLLSSVSVQKTSHQRHFVLM